MILDSKDRMLLENINHVPTSLVHAFIQEHQEKDQLQLRNTGIVFKQTAGKCMPCMKER